MADIQITNPSTIQDIIYKSSRLKQVLTEFYGIKLNEISAIRLDSDNFKIDVFTQDNYYRFKPKGFEDILITNPEIRNMELKFDPALAQAIYRILSAYMYETANQD